MSALTRKKLDITWRDYSDVVIDLGNAARMEASKVETVVPVETSEIICVICLKKVDKKGESKSNGRGSCFSPQSSILFKRLQDNESNKTSSSEQNDLLTRLLTFATRYCGMWTLTEQILKDVKKRQMESGSDEIQAFCHTCKSLVSNVCELYSELQVTKLNLAWKLTELGRKLKESNRIINSKYTKGKHLMKSVAKQLGVNYISSLKNFRNILQIRCIKNKKNAVPKVVVPRGLLPERWKYTFSATKAALMRIIVVFALANFPILNPEDNLKQPLREKADAKLKRKHNRQEEKSSAGFSNSSHPIKMEVPCEVNSEEFNKAASRNVKQIEGDSFGENPNEEMDMDWSNDPASPVNTNANSDDSDFNPSDNECDPEVRPQLRRNMRRKRKVRKIENEDKSADSDSPEEDRNRDEEFKVNRPESSKNAKEQNTFVRNLPCPKCDRFFVDQRGLAGHLLKIHGSHIDHSCKYCGLKFKRLGDIIVHCRKMHSDKHYRGPRRKVKAVIKDESSRTVPCPKCNKMFLDSRGLAKHLMYTHRSSINYSCQTCGKKFARSNDLVLHKRKDHGQTHREALLGSRSQTIKKQGYTAREGATTKCTKCPKVFPSRCLMQKHRATAHNIHHYVREQCPICFLISFKHEQFQLHIAAHFSISEKKNPYSSISISDNTPQFSYCQVCGDRFPHQSVLSEHIKLAHQDSILCYTCNATFETGNALKCHLEVHETSEQPYQCNFCYRRFTTSQYFNLHWKLAHLGRTTIKCDHIDCSEHFESVQLLNEHLTTHLTISRKEPSEALQDSDSTDVSNQKTEIFHCNTCKWGFLTEYDRALHELLHTPSSMEMDGFDCPKCGQNHKSIDSLTVHFNDSHQEVSGNAYMECPTCEMKYLSAVYFKAHLQSHKEEPNSVENDQKYNCKMCSMECQDLVCLRVHQKVHPELDGENAEMESSSNFVIGECGFKKPQTKGRLRRKTRKVGGSNKHTRTIINFGNKAAKCDVCEKEYESIMELREHLAELHETEDKTEQCWFCSLRFTVQQSLKIHHWSIHDSNLFRCEEFGKCNKKFATLEELENHLKDKLANLNGSEGNLESTDDANQIVVGIENGTMKSPSLEESLENPIKRCSKCSWCFLSQDRLELHELVHLERVNSHLHCPKCPWFFNKISHLQAHYNKKHGQNIKNYECTICGTKLTSQESWDSHMARHKRRSELKSGEKILCTKCDFQTLDHTLLKKHMDKWHNSVMFVKCIKDGCDKTFPTKRRMLFHLNKDHNVGKNHMCHICGAAFSIASDVKCHMKNVHVEASYVCDICGKSYKRRHVLEAHKESHNPDRMRYICSECGVEYKTDVGLQYHIGSMHTPENEKKFRCPYCSKGYHRKTLCRMHMKSCAKQQDNQLPSESNPINDDGNLKTNT